MVRKRLVVFCLAATSFWLLAARAARAADSPASNSDVIDSLDARVRPFLEGVSGGETQQAFDTLLRGSPRMLTQKGALKTLIEQTNQLQSKFGRYRSFEKIDARWIGKDLVVMRYLYKCDDFPVIWHFAFYRPPPPADAPAGGNAWRVIIVRFDTDLEKAAR